MNSAWHFLVGCGLLAIMAAQAVAQPVSRGTEVTAATHFDVSPRLQTLRAAPARGGPPVALPLRPIPRPRALPGMDPVLQRFAASPQLPALSKNFDGVGNGFSGPQGAFIVNAAPPDPNLAVGPNHIVQLVNTALAVWDKATGSVVYGPVAINTLWSGFGGGCQTNNDGDPIALYDAMSDRWVITQFSVSTTPYLECVAVSTTGDPTGTYNRYSFSYGNTEFPDYPKLGVWPDAYYVTYNIFNGTTFSGAKICALDRAKMLQGLTATQQCFANTSTAYGGLLPADLDGSRLPPAGSPNYLLGLGDTAASLALWKAHIDWATPGDSTLTGPIAITVPAYVEACSIGAQNGVCIPQANTTQQLDSLSDRLMYRLAYRNFIDHESLVVNHSVDVGSGSNSNVGVRWYEIRSPGAAPVVFQSGTYAPDANYRWMGSIAMDQSGNIALGFSCSGTSIKPQIHLTARLAGDAAGQMTQGESSIIDGAGSQTTDLSRWGDYTAMRVDPADGCTFWYTNQYIPTDGTFNWSTRIASFRFPTCGPPQATSTLLSTSLNPSVFEQQVTFTAGVAPSTATGTVQFLDGATVLGVATLSAGSASLSTSSLSVGSHSIAAVYSGDASYAASTSPAVTQTVTTADLSNLVLSVGTLSPPFASGTLSYTASVVSSSNTITVTPTAADASATVKVNGVVVTSGSPSAPITLSIGSNPITVLVSAVGGVTTQTYSVDVNYLPLSACTYALSPLDLSNTTAAGGAHNVIVTTPAGCPVTATSYQPWVTVTSVTLNGGTTTVALQISANAGPTRATAIVVADRLFLVTQLGP